MEISTLDPILGDHFAVLGADVTPYRIHAYRVANLCLVQSPGGAEALERIAIAAAFHDLGIWTDLTVRLPCAVGEAGQRLARPFG